MVTEIRVNYDTKTLQNGILYLPIIIALTSIWLYFFNYMQNILSDSLLTHTNIFYYIAQMIIIYIIKPVLILFIFMLLLALIYGIYFISKPSKLAAILNKDGIWLDRYGFIAWDNINDIFIYRIPTTPMENIGIRFHDAYSVFKQATLSGKLTIIYSKIFRYPVTLAKLEMDNEIFVAHAKRFMHIS